MKIVFKMYSEPCNRKQRKARGMRPASQAQAVIYNAPQRAQLLRLKRFAMEAA